MNNNNFWKFSVYNFIHKTTSKKIQFIVKLKDVNLETPMH